MFLLNFLVTSTFPADLFSILTYYSYTAVRSGDYYMFDEFDDTEVHLKDEESSSDEEGPQKEMGIGKVLCLHLSQCKMHAFRFGYLFVTNN